MQTSRTQDKYEIFKEFYYKMNGVKLSYKEATSKFYEMDSATKLNFEQFYRDEMNYEIVFDSNGSVLSPLVSPTGYSIKKHTKSNRALINQKYTIQAYAQQNGMILDPIWGQYSAEEIVQMENEGVLIPQEVLNIAHTILNSSVEEVPSGEETEEETTEKEPFLELIPKAQDHIKRCEENNEKIDEKVDELLAQNSTSNRKLKDKIKDQKTALEEYEDFVREWRHLQNKINNGETLSFSEAKRYAQLTGMLEDKNSSASDFGLDKREIAKEMNEINILSILGEKLADETIEIGENLADYTCKSNYKATQQEVSVQIGFIQAFISMALGKELSKEATKIGNETKDYSEATSNAVDDIASIIGIENMMINPENPEQPTGIEAGESQKEDEDFIINDENVLALIDEAFKIDKDLGMQVKTAFVNLYNAKLDTNFVKKAEKRIEKLIRDYQDEEANRQQEINSLEQENKDAEVKLKDITGMSYEEYQTNKDNNLDAADDIQARVQVSIIENNNSSIEALKAESVEAVEKLKNSLSIEKSKINEALPKEQEALENDSKYKDEIIPADKERLKFVKASGKTLSKMGVYRVIVGTEQIASLQIRKGVKNVIKGTISLGIGLAAQVVSSTPIPDAAEKLTDKAVGSEEEAIRDLNNLDTKIISVTGEDSAMEKVEEEQEEASDEGQEEQTEEVSDGEPVEQNDTTTQTATPVAQTSPSTHAKLAKAPVSKSEAQVLEVVSEDEGAKEPKRGSREAVKAIMANAEAPVSTPTASSSKKDKDMDTDKAQEIVDDAAADGEKTGKDSEKVQDDTEKDENQLKKETKTIQKRMKKDEKDIAKMTKESMQAAKKQEELLKRYEELNAENDEIVAQEEKSQMSQPAQPVAQNQSSQGSANAMSVSATGQTSSSENIAKLETNNQELAIIGGQFSNYGNVITRNRVKILKLQKTTRKNEKAFAKKTKIMNKQIKEAQKAEQEKQKKLAKQLGIVGIQENIFSITLATGEIMQLSGYPPTVAAGTTLVTIGTSGVAACGLTKAIINLANGNAMGALMGLGQTAITIVGSCLPGVGAAAGNVLTQVSAGLSIVASSAELVNNVRAVQGKEANSTLGMISAIAGAASAVTSAAAAFSNTYKFAKDGTKIMFDSAMKQASTFGKIAKVAGMVGSAMSSTSQIMQQFGGDSKIAELLGMVGGAVSLAASATQLMAPSAMKTKDSSTEKTANSDNKDNTNNAENKDNTKTDNKENNKSETDKKTEAKDDKKETTNLKQVNTKSNTDSKTTQDANTQVQKDVQQVTEKEVQNETNFQALETNNKEAKDLVNEKNNDQNNDKNKPLEGVDLFAQPKIEEVDIKNSKLAAMIEKQKNDELRKQARKETFDKVSKVAEGVMQTATSIIAMSQSSQANKSSVKSVAPGQLTKRSKEIIEKTKRQVKAIARAQINKDKKKFYS